MPLSVTVLGLLVVLQGVAGTLDLSKAKSKITFLAIGQPSALRIKGEIAEGDALNGTLTVGDKTLTGKALLRLSALNTGIEMRDMHMKEKYLEIQRYPTAELTLSNVSIGTKDVPFNGQLKLHGTTRPISGKASLKVQATALSLWLEFTLLLKDYLIEIPGYLGIKVANNVTVSVFTEGTLL